MSDQRFCPLCDVTMDLHPDTEDDGWACDIASQKADLLGQFAQLQSRLSEPYLWDGRSLYATHYA